jgi:hypothetical protein
MVVDQIESTGRTGTMNTNDTATTLTVTDYRECCGTPADPALGMGHANGCPVAAQHAADNLTTLTGTRNGQTVTFEHVDDILPGEDAGTEEPTFTVEMWTTDLYDGSISEIYSRSYPVTTRKHDAIRNLATFALATPEVGPYHVRVPRRFIRVNSAQGVAWDTRNVASAAYFRIVEA